MNYYRINFLNYGEHFGYGKTAIQAIQAARYELTTIRNNLDLPAIELGNASARRAVYGEWDCGQQNYYADGTHRQH
jgi:hypothetical protein